MLNWRTSVLGQQSTCPKTGLQNEPKRLGKWAKIGTTNWTPYKITIGGTPEQRQNDEEAFYKEYQHKGDTVDIELKLNDNSFKNINRTDYQSFMVSNIDVESIFPSNTKDNLNLANILKNAFIDCEDIDSFVSSNVGEIIREVNK